MPFSPHFCLFPVVEEEDGSAQSSEGENRNMLDKKASFFCSLTSNQGLPVARRLFGRSCSFSLRSLTADKIICLMLKMLKAFELE